MPKHKHNQLTGPEPVPFLWGDLISLLDTWSLRLTERRASGVDVDCAQTRAAIEAVVDRQGLRPGLRCAVPLRAVYDELRRDSEARNFTPWQAGAQARTALVNALNDEDGGLELVRCRRLSMAS